MTTIPNPGMRVLTWSQPVDTTAADLIWINGVPQPEDTPVRAKMTHAISAIADQRREQRQRLSDRCWVIRFREGAGRSQIIRTIVDITTEAADPDRPAPTGITSLIDADLIDAQRTRYVLQEIQRFASETGQAIDPTTTAALTQLLNQSPPPGATGKKLAIGAAAAGLAGLVTGAAVGIGKHLADRAPTSPIS